MSGRATSEVSATRRRNIWRPVPRDAENGGYLYAVAFDNGVVKVGRTLNPRGRLTNHRSGGRVFGAELTDWWVSPRHDCWEANEGTLIELAHQLGGIPTGGAEYFTGIDYDQLVEKAQALNFSAPAAVTVSKKDAARRAARMADWLADAIDDYRQDVLDGVLTRKEAAGYLTDQVLALNVEFARVIVGRYFSRRLPPAARKPPSAAPEPPDPCPPAAPAALVAA
jgi:hypothetical protein